MVPIPIVYQHSDFIIVNKPAGLSVHSDQNIPGLVVHLQQQLQTDHLWLAHRLDRVTSGLLILARTQKAAQFFSKAFEQRRIEKFYLALSDRKPSKKQGKIIGDMVKARNGTWKLMKTLSNPAKTQFFSQSILPGKRLFLLKPQTGKTHQLRVMMKSISAPILGDQTYKGTTFERTCLHAYQLAFRYFDDEIRIRCLPTADPFEDILHQHLPNEFLQPDRLKWPQ